jgi:NADH:ubiquinone oxidoreductase subunit 2 (subunit N)
MLTYSIIGRTGYILVALVAGNKAWRPIVKLARVAAVMPLGGSPCPRGPMA